MHRHRCAAIEDNLKGEFMTGVPLLCSPEFFAALTGPRQGREGVRELAGRAPSDQRCASGFTYAGITFEEYRVRPPMPVDRPSLHRRR